MQNLAPLAFVLLSIALPQQEETTQQEIISLEKAYLVRYVILPGPITLNQPFSLELEVLSNETKQPVDEQTKVFIDGRMPQHRHGMNTEPTVKQLGKGRYRVDGMRFHMPGRWVIHFDISRDGITERAQGIVQLKF